MDTYELLFNYVSNLGFPVVLSLYLLHRFERKLGDLEHAIQELITINEPPKTKNKE